LPIEKQITDRDGVARFASTAGLTRERAPVAIVSRHPKTGDMAWLSVADRANLEDNPALTDGKVLSDEGLTGLLFTERGLYRPGETVHLGSLVAKGNLRALPEGLPVTLTLADPVGREVLRETLTLSPDGLAESAHALPPEALPGTWQVRLLAGRDVIAETTFFVRDFEPERMRLALTNARQSDGWLHPNEIALNVELKRQFGTRAAHQRLILTASLDGRPTHRFAR
ncbi:protein containing Alpha-2-macroglobulin, partial [gut metagenome]